MRFYVVLILMLSFSFKCFAQVDFNKTVKSVANKKCNASVKSKIYLSTYEGFCTSSIIINDDSTFRIFTGCESKSYIKTGKWRMVGDSIEFTSYKNHHENLICDIKIIDPKKSQWIKIHVYDKNGHSYNNFGFSLFNNPKRLKDTINNFFSSASTIECDSCENRVFSNYNGQFVLETNGFKYLEIEDFSIFQASRFAFLIKDLPAEFSITVDYNQFEHTGEIEYKSNGKPFKYYYSKEKLIIDEYVFESIN